MQSLNMWLKSHLTFWKLYFKIAQSSSLAFPIYLSSYCCSFKFDNYGKQMGVQRVENWVDAILEKTWKFSQEGFWIRNESIYMISFHFILQLWQEVITPLPRWDKWGKEWLGNLPRVTQLPDLNKELSILKLCVLFTTPPPLWYN